jgi:hypothetical protein
MSSQDDEENPGGKRALDFVFANNDGRISNTGFFSLPGLGGSDFEENDDKYFPFRNQNEDSRDPRQVELNFNKSSM